MNLFQKGNIKLSSGVESDFKIECDAFTDKDWECIAYLINQRIKFCGVIGVPTGGEKLQNYLNEYHTSDKSLPYLICDDVLTTGASMEKIRKNLPFTNIIGAVVFTRGKCPDWVTPLFSLTPATKEKGCKYCEGGYAPTHEQVGECEPCIHCNKEEYFKH